MSRVFKILNLKSLFLLLCLIVFQGCSSKPYLRQELPSLHSEKTFESQRANVWRSVLKATEEFKFEEMNEEKGFLMTQWGYSTSSDKYLLFKVNGVPKRKTLQIRYRYLIQVTPHPVGTHVAVGIQEEIEKLDEAGAFDSWVEVSDAEIDTQRSQQMLKRIEMALLSLPDVFEKK